MMLLFGIAIPGAIFWFIGLERRKRLLSRYHEQEDTLAGLRVAT
jgi:hypothetical protein